MAARKPSATSGFDHFVRDHRPRAAAAAAAMLGLPVGDPRVGHAVDRAFAQVWSQRWWPWGDREQQLRRALVHQTRPGNRRPGDDPPITPDPAVMPRAAVTPEPQRRRVGIMELRSRADEARAHTTDGPSLARRGVLMAGAGVATAGTATALGLAVRAQLRTERAEISNGERLRLTVDLVGSGHRRMAEVRTSDPRWSIDLPAVVARLVIDDARGSSVIVPTPGLTRDATLQTMVVHQPGLVFADVVQLEVVPFTCDHTLPIAAAIFALDVYGSSVLVWGDEFGRVHADEQIVSGTFPGDTARVCYLLHGQLVVRNLVRTVSQPHCEPHDVRVDPVGADPTLPGIRASAVTLPDGTGLVAVVSDEAGDLSWDLPSLASSTDQTRTARFWHVESLPSGRRDLPARRRVTLRTPSREVQYDLLF